ncbi:MAG TPA: cytochrome P450 [Acidimicrobiia bacterium]
MTLPGPRSPLAQLRTGVTAMREPAEALRRLRGEYGPVVAFGVRPYRYVALFGPEANRYLLAEHPENFRWREALRVLIPVDGATALVVSDGPEHRRRRHLVQPAFGTRRIEGYLDVMTDEIDRELDRWTVGRELDAFACLRDAVRRVAVRTLFGDELGGRADELGTALAAAIDFVNLPPMLQLRVDLPWTRWHRARIARDRADVIVNDEIARRRAERDRDDSSDLLDALLAARDDETGDGLSDVEIRDQVVSLVAAGFETTSATAAWAVHELLTNDGEWERAAQEVDAVVGDHRPTIAHFARMQHLDAVVNETLRLWPAGFLSARYAVDGFEFDGHEIPARSTVLYSPFVTHRDPRWWPEPDRFDPDRWRDGREPTPYTFLPFGGGYRRCIGFAFATQELKVLLTRLLQRVRLIAEPVPVVGVGAAALRPKHGVPVRVEERRAVAIT